MHLVNQPLGLARAALRRSRIAEPRLRGLAHRLVNHLAHQTTHQVTGGKLRCANADPPNYSVPNGLRRFTVYQAPQTAARVEPGFSGRTMPSREMETAADLGWHQVAGGKLRRTKRRLADYSVRRIRSRRMIAGKNWAPAFESG